MTGAGASPFSPRTLLAVIAVGAGAFLLLLYAIGAGWDGEDRNGGAHAAATGLNGFAGFARLLEELDHEVTLSRSAGRLDEEGLLVLTPQHTSDGEALAEIVAARRYIGPTLLILPKWIAMPAAGQGDDEVPQGWVTLLGTVAPGWTEDLEGFADAKIAVGKRARWDGLGLSGAPASPGTVMALDADSVIQEGEDGEEWAGVLPLVTDEQGDTLVGYLNDIGNYPRLDEAAGFDAPGDPDEGLFPVVVVVDPDLMNNYGLADESRARVAEAIVDLAREGYDLPVVFDLTLAGLGQGENLLTLAFRPPFLAATLCLILAALVIAWRGFRRFGPPVAEAPTLAMGKRQLARNAAGLVERARRWHLLGPPYAALVVSRVAVSLGIREADPAAREAAIARVLASRGIDPDFSGRVEALRQARLPGELLRAAGALRTIERTLAS